MSLSKDHPLPSPPSPPTQPSSDQHSPQLHSEIRSVVQLNTAHAYKTYYSGPLVRKYERLPDGQRPTKDEGWTDIWAQLGGTTLSIWDMKQVQEASKLGKEVPPAYVNMTDAFVQVIGAVTVPESPTSPAKRYTDILAVNTAGSNLILFSCPSREALISWVAALRLSSWEKSRLEEIYTAHLVRVTQLPREVSSTLVRGKLEGWARIRIAGQTDWKRLWMTVQAGADAERPSSGADFDSPSNGILRKRRVSSLFSRDHSPARGPAHPIVSFYASQKPKDKKKPLLTMQGVTQAFAVYPERPELINKSTLFKLEGQFADEELARDMKNREGWILIMPDLEVATNQVKEMLKWVIAIHDAFELYGRPLAWTWDPRERVSMMFGYPVGAQKESLFLNREAAETLDPRDDRTSSIRANLRTSLCNKMQNAGIRVIPPELQRQQQPALQTPPGPQPPQPELALAPTPQLPPLSFGEPSLPRRTALPPVAEASGRNTPDVEVASNDLPPNPISLPIAAAASRSPAPSVSTSQVHQRQPSITSQTPSHVSSVPPPSSPPVGGFKMKSSEDNSSLSSNRDRIQPLPMSPSQSAAGDRPESRTSILTSPHSIAGDSAKHRSLDTMPSLASPYSPILPRRDLPPIGPPPNKALPTAPYSDLSNEHIALYYLSDLNSEPPVGTKQQPPRVPMTIAEQDGTNSSHSEHVALDSGNLPATSQPTELPQGQEPTKTPPIRQSTPPAFVERPASSLPASRQSPRSGLGRKPSGARELGTGRHLNDGISSSTKSPDDSDISMEVPQVPPPQVKVVESLPHDDSNLDVIAALSYLDVDDGSSLPSVEPLKVRSAERSQPSSPTPAISTPIMPSPITSDVKPATQFKSSFALSKQAVERKAKVQAQQIARDAAAHKPGRLNGKRKSRVAGAWNVSSDEEDDEDEDDDDDADSGDDEPSSNKPKAPSSGNASSSASLKHHQNQNQPSHHPETVADYHGPQPRGPRTLPQVPSTRFHGEDSLPQPRRMVSDQYSDTGKRPNHDDAPQIRSQSEFPHPGPAQKSLWSQVLEPGRNPGQLPEQHHHTRDTFIQLEHPSETMTKAFTPQGLLSAGLQDKQDRSAKRQEELARETGASLINVPNKPPPPQTGLLGAITAHERERKREGGVGAALTERERERRLAEERQRRFDEQQRQQLEQLQQGGSVYGQFPGFNPMMNPMMMGMMGMNPMMTGMPPMMTGGMPPMMTGYPSMMPGLSPQQMFAAQQAAAHAYQQAMVAFSSAASQAGAGENGTTTQPMVPNATGSMGFMGGYDPRMSMMGMGMMTPQMGMPLGMQMTGMSTFDPRFSGNGGTMNETGLQPPNVLGGPNPVSRSSSPANRPEQHGDIPRGSRPTSPKP